MRLQMKHKGEPMYVDVPEMDELKSLARFYGVTLDDITKGIAQLVKNKIKVKEAQYETRKRTLD